MASDHRRILATGLGRLRSKLKYRPVLFELAPETFTLSELQAAAEAVAGLPLHKQNFRRGVERTGLVEATGRLSAATGGRPAELFRFTGADPGRRTARPPASPSRPAVVWGPPPPDENRQYPLAAHVPVRLEKPLARPSVLTAPRRGGRVVECTALEMRRAWKGTVGSNPTLSAIPLVAKCRSAGRR
jgi:hypothetical protein